MVYVVLLAKMFHYLDMKKYLFSREKSPSRLLCLISSQYNYVVVTGKSVRIVFAMHNILSSKIQSMVFPLTCFLFEYFNCICMIFVYMFCCIMFLYQPKSSYRAYFILFMLCQIKIKRVRFLIICENCNQSSHMRIHFIFSIGYVS